jgi:hypothetical protein
VFSNSNSVKQLIHFPEKISPSFSFPREESLHVRPFDPPCLQRKELEKTDGNIYLSSPVNLDRLIKIWKSKNNHLRWFKRFKMVSILTLPFKVISLSPRWFSFSRKKSLTVSTQPSEIHLLCFEHSFSLFTLCDDSREIPPALLPLPTNSFHTTHFLTKLIPSHLKCDLLFVRTSWC